MATDDRFDPIASCDVAIIGMAGRFPKSSNVSDFWENLKRGAEGISFFSDDEMEVYIAPEDLRNPNFVKAKGVLDEIDLFDASFFNISAREAQWMDPQQRLFLESAWEALENAGYNPSSYKGQVAVYAGVNTNTYLLSRLDKLVISGPSDFFHILLSNEKDHLATRVAYKLDLRGEAITIQTSCSTSLVAVHLACQSLLSGQSTMALAGGVSIRVPQKTGYFYQDGMIASPDGHCRAFDHNARGTVPGHGLGIVVLKLMSDAIRDGDYIHAVIKGSAINNDGHLKMGYTAPSVEGQSDVISRAMAIAGVDADQISYVEAHGTGTALGDPIEVEALTRVFRRQTARKTYCALGSVKTNIGHLDNAAGVAGLIKTALALNHRQIPPTLHFERPNPALDLEASPFYIASSLQDWKSDGAPRRAGVSSFGIGGTNAHVILEEPPPQVSDKTSHSLHFITLSAKSGRALERMVQDLAGHLERHPELNLADVAYTRNVGRQEFAHRTFLVAANREEAIAQLRASRAKTSVVQQSPRTVFMFSGQGTQSVNMARHLYEELPAFRQDVNECASILQTHIGSDIRDLLYPKPDREQVAAAQLERPRFTLPALFTIEYALAKLWMSWGVKPAAMIGHSFGEYTAACLSGVFSLEQALGLVAARGRLIERLPEGAMVAVRLSEKEARRSLRGSLAVAAVNSETGCTISGTTSDIEQFERQTSEQKTAYRRLNVSYGYHSAMIDTIIPEFTERVAELDLQPPRIPFISNLTGTWITQAQATDPKYWADQMRHTVKFAAGLDALIAGKHTVFLEVGPNKALSMLAREHLGRNGAALILSSLGGPQSRRSDVAVTLNSLGDAWLAGIEVDWVGFYPSERRLRLPLPTYPFERQRHWIEASDKQGFQSAPAAATSETDSKQPLENGGDRQPVERSGLREDYIAPRNEIEQTVAEIWGAVLGLNEIGINDNFFELGGDSLIATQVFSRIKQSLTADIALEQMLTYQTIAELSQEVQRTFRVGGDSSEAAKSEAPVYYCAFDFRVGEDRATVFMTEQDYLLQGIPETAENFRMV